jgi:hypothetical protein
MLKIFLDSGIEVDTRDEFGRTPLLMATHSSETQIDATKYCWPKEQMPLRDVAPMILPKGTWGNMLERMPWSLWRESGDVISSI